MLYLFIADSALCSLWVFLSASACSLLCFSAQGLWVYVGEVRCRIPIYDYKSWKELNTQEKQAAKNLGWGKNEWDNDIPIANESKQFSDLTSDQRADAELLGYTASDWNNNENATFNDEESSSASADEETGGK